MLRPTCRCSTENTKYENLNTKNFKHKMLIYNNMNTLLVNGRDEGATYGDEYKLL